MNKNDLNELYNDVTSKEQMKKKSKNKKYILIISTICFFLGLGYFSWSILQSKDSSINEDDKTDYAEKELSSSEKESSEKSEKEKTTEIYKNSTTPIKIEDWMKTPYSDQKDDSSLRENGLNYSIDTLFNNYTKILPSEDNGYTSDVSKAENTDGTPNLNYSYLTAEQVSYVYSMYINRLLNPVFGGWNSLPYGVEGGAENNFPEDKFKDMFSEEWWSNNIQDDNHSAIPILADWAGDSWGGIDVEGKALGVWYGEIKSINVTTESSKTNIGVDFIIELKVEYKAILTDKTKATKEGTLKIKLIPNLKSTDPENRMVIDEVLFNTQNKQ